jgi:glycosyltransferase involved in cell wall biosynthesis
MSLAQDRPRVSVIVPHFNDLARLDRCLACLEAQTFSGDRLEIIVADNGSPQGEAAVQAVIAGRARLVIAEEKGAGPARNAGVAASRGEILAFTDADCLPEPSWLAEGVDALSRFDLVGGQVTVVVADPDRPSAVEAFEAVFAFDNETYVNRLGFTVTANLFCPRALFERVGGFRTGISEDLDWSHRARDAGYRLGYAPAATVGHPARASWAELRAKWRRLNAETLGLQSQSFAGRAKWVLRSVLLPASAVAHTPKVMLSPRLHGWAERLGALTVLYRIRLWRSFDAIRLLTRGGHPA